MQNTVQWDTLASDVDNSVNHVLPHSDGGFWETRWVQRTSDYGIAYLSSHTGCAFSCRFCHLTATKQTMMTPASVDTYAAQMRQALSTYQDRRAAGLEPIARLHVNFMARGEALDNPNMLQHSHELFAGLDQVANEAQQGLDTHYLVSSILPRTFSGDLAHILAHPQSHLYYSLYSVNPQFRKRWLPKALPSDVGLDLCAQYQRDTGRKLTLHWAFIEGQNDSDGDIDALLDAVLSRNIHAKFNLVRYNPHDSRHGTEPQEARLQAIFSRIQKALGDQDSRIVPRVGFDVKASCGMFVANTSSTSHS